MNKDRIVGLAKQAEGIIKASAGRVLGDITLVAEGQREKVEGKIQNAVGGAKDAMKDAINKR